VGEAHPKKKTKKKAETKPRSKIGKGGDPILQNKGKRQTKSTTSFSQEKGRGGERNKESNISEHLKIRENTEKRGNTERDKVGDQQKNAPMKYEGLTQKRKGQPVWGGGNKFGAP